MTKNFWIACILTACAASSHFGATIWNGPTITFNKTSSAPSDTILPSKVVLKRGGNGPLFNTALSETSARPGSPKGVTFAFGTLDDVPNLPASAFVTLDSLRHHPHLSSAILNKQMVAHIADGDIYFSILFTKWSAGGSGLVTYIRSTAATAIPPTVSLTAPSDNATFTAPANITLSADAGNGTITGVSFYNGTSLLGTVASAPYNFTVNGAAAGSYVFTAVATTLDSSATSGVVHVTVTAPVPPTVSITSPAEGATFAAPANVNVTAEAGNGTIASVSLFNGSDLVNTVTSAPYNFTLSNLAAGSYALSAVASTANSAATSGIVHITVTAPVSTPTFASISAANGQFSFEYSTVPGGTYVIENATDLNSNGGLNWSPVATNNPSGSTATFSISSSSDHFRFFRVGQLTTP